MTDLYLLNPDAVAEVFTLDLAYDSQIEAFTALAKGDAWQPDKIGGGHADDNSTLFCYAARLNRGTGPVSKFGSVNPGNPGMGLPSIHATVVLLHPDTGVPVAILDGTAITARRTAAASAVAVTHLAHRVDQIGIVGAGQQGVAHIRSLYHRFPQASFRLWSPEVDQVARAVETLGTEGVTVSGASTLDAAVCGAGVVVTATQATQPLFAVDLLEPDALVISIGSFEEHRCEIGADILRAGTVVVDHAPTARAHSGPVVTLPGVAVAELGDVITGAATLPVRGIRSYLSVGLGVQDAAAAWAIYRRARAEGAGTVLPW